MSLISVLTAPVVPAASLPTAAFTPNPAFGVVGSVVKLDGRQSVDPDQLPLTYTWRFISVPIGSQVRGEGFRALEIDSTTGSPILVSFSPDIVGEYVIGLVVSNGVFSSIEATSLVRIRAILVPHGRGVIPDGKFIWSYIRDVWTQVDGKEWFETLWSALIQIVGSEMLKLYQTDFNKSIRDIQDQYQRRWLSYEPKLLLDDDNLTFYFGTQTAGTDASTINLGLEGQAVILSSNEVIIVVGARLQNVAGESFSVLYSIDPSNVGTYELSGLNAARNGYKLSAPELDAGPDQVGNGVRWTFPLGGTTWALDGTVRSRLAETLSEWAPFSDSLLPLFNQPSGSANLIQKGDVIHYPNGPNAGFYRILDKSGSYVIVDHAPPSSSPEGSQYTSDVYRPVGFTVTQPASAVTNTFSVPYTPGSNDLSLVAPGRLVVVNGQALTIVRSAIDNNQLSPVVVVGVDSNELLADLRGLNWRTPNTLISKTQDFEDLGVSTGDLIVFDVFFKDRGISSEFKAQVLGVHGNSLGFVLTDERVTAGELPEVPAEAILQLATDFGIDGVGIGPDGKVVYSGTALAFFNSIDSGVFKRKYWNIETTPDSDISVNPLFQIKPKYVIRNRLLPVDSELRSVPALQDWIVQPTISERDGKLFQAARGKDYEITRRPTVLTENLDYLVDDEFVFIGQMTINTGSTDLFVDDADFVDRGMTQGDYFIIEAPLTLSGTYIIERVISNNEIKLTRPIPAYVLGEFVIANITLKRKKTGHFLRFVPGRFTAKNPAPDRLWAEASLFDNNQTVEDNFGLLVGLKRSALETVSRNINYRQAVSGLMFALTRGSIIDKVRLGAQILLGLPFAEHRGIIRSIEDNYRLDINGVPILGRLLVEDIDADGKPLGTLRIYTYPIDLASALAGIDINPATGKTYVVGDVVELFAPLSKGVEIIDYISNPLDSSFDAFAQLQKYHSVRLRANDNIFNLNELDLVSDFLKKITPSYVSYSLITASEFADTVSITDLLLTAFLTGADNAIIDNVSMSLPATMMYNSRTPDGAAQIYAEDGVLLVRRVGEDLMTINSSSTVSSAKGGFLNPRSYESFEGPLTLVGDLLIVLEGLNKGVYPITAIPSDTQVTVSGLAFGFESEGPLRFVIGRRVSTPLSTGTVAVSTGSATITIPGAPQLRTRGVAPGDWFVVDDGTYGRRYLITQVKESTPGSGVWNQVILNQLPNFTNAAAPYTIYRPALLTSGSFSVTSSGSNLLTSPSNPHLSALLDIGDELVTSLANQTRVTVLDPRRLYTVPALPAGTYTVTIARKNRASTIVGWDHLEKFGPIDRLEATISSSTANATLTSGSASVGMSANDPQLILKTLPGDLFIVSSGANSTVDVGYGPGVYPIVAVTSSTLTLSVQLTASGSSTWKILRRR